MEDLREKSELHKHISVFIDKSLSLKNDGTTWNVAMKTLLCSVSRIVIDISAKSVQVSSCLIDLVLTKQDRTRKTQPSGASVPRVSVPGAFEPLLKASLQRTPFRSRRNTLSH